MRINRGLIKRAVVAHHKTKFSMRRYRQIKRFAIVRANEAVRFFSNRPRHVEFFWSARGIDVLPYLSISPRFSRPLIQWIEK